MVVAELLAQQHYTHRLTELIRSGECVLFLGAGVSLDAGAPSGKQLGDELGAKFFQYAPGMLQLDQVSALVDANEGRKVLNEWLLERFRGLEPRGALLDIPLFKWRSIYTVNIDTLLEEAYARTPDRLQDLRPFYSDKDSLSRLRPNEVALYKLHGCLSRANAEDGRLVLTQEDFAQVHESRQRLLNRLLDDMSDFGSLYVGFRRQDPDFTRVLLDVERAAGGLTGLRRGYALQPHYTEPEARLWEQKRVTLIDAKAADFFAGLKASFPAGQRFVPPAEGSKQEAQPPLLVRKPKIGAEVLADIARSFEIVDERIREQGTNVGEFFTGAPPSWGTVVERIDAPRDLQDEVLGAVLQDPHLDRAGAQVVLLHAEAGTGKTTLLRRLGADLALTWDKVVVALKPYEDLDFLALERLAQAADERVYVLVDDASGLARELKDTLGHARRAKTKLTILTAARTNEWREAQEDHALPSVQEFELGPLSRREIEAILDTLAEHEALGLLAGASREAQIAAFEQRADKQLLVALREATEGKAFDQIVVDEYDRIPSPDGQRAYLLVAALHKLGIFTRVGLLRRALGIPYADLQDRVFAPTTKVIVTREVQDEPDYYYSARHQLIAEIVFDRKIGSERRRLEYYSEIIARLDLGYSSDADAFRKLTRGKNKLLLRDFDNPDNRRELMRQLIRLDPSDAFTYQHAAMMELEEENLEAASQHINRAIELRPGDFSIRDTEGRLALLSASLESDPTRADAKFARAEEIFTRNIQRRRDEPFGYRHLAETYVGWAARQERDERRLHYLGLAYEALLDGLDRCASVSMLLQYQGEMEETLGNPGKARIAFARALGEKPGDLTTRFMAARLEEREGFPQRALELLEGGLETSPQDPRLHYRLAVLMATVQPQRDLEVRRHFEAALLGPLRNYQPRLAYGAYLFSRGDFQKAAAQFAELDDVLVPNRERFEMRKFPFGQLNGRHAGRIRRLSYTHGFVDFGQGGTEVFFSMRQLPPQLARALYVGRPVSFDIRFNLKGAVATALALTSPAQAAKAS